MSLVAAVNQSDLRSALKRRLPKLRPTISWIRFRPSLLILLTPILFHNTANSADARHPPSLTVPPHPATIELPIEDKQDVRFVQATADGEPFQGQVVGIAQDNRGFLWLGGPYGLYRYDGYSLKSYRHDSGDPNSLSDDSVTVLVKDRAGSLWIGGPFGGLDRFDPAQDKFTHYRHDPGDERTLGNNAVNCVYQDRSGALWVGTNTGLDRHDPANETFVHYRHNSQNEGSARSNEISAIAEDRAGNLWVGSASGLDRFDRTTGRFIRVLSTRQGGTNGIDPNHVSDVREDRSGILWVATRSALRSLDVTTGRFTEYSFRPAEPDGARIVILHILEDQDGILWLGTLENGLLKLDAERKKITRYAMVPDNRYTLPNRLVSALLEDAEGGLWAGTQTGLSRFSRRRPNFVNYQHDSLNPRSLRNNSIDSVLEDKQGCLWVAGQGGLGCLDRQTGLVTTYRHDPTNPYSPGANTVYAICEDRKGTLWFGTYGGGLDRFDRATGRFIAYRHDPRREDSLSSDYVLSLLEDSHGTLWVGTQGGGLNRFDPTTSRFTSWRHDPQNPRSLSHDNVITIREDRDGYLWVGTLDGLNRFDPKTIQFVAYHNSLDPRSLSHNKVNAIWEDEEGALWVATENGLNLLDKNKSTFKRFTKKDGLPDNSIQTVLEDKEGYLWLGTDNGLSQFHRQNGVVRNYFELDGLPGNNFRVASFRNSRYELIFGTSNGVTAFYPKRLTPASNPPPVVMTAFELFNKPVKPGVNSVLRAPIWATHSLSLHHNQSIFTIEFAALSYAVPEENRYRYRLEPLESEWNEVNFRRRLATYSSLPAGNYTFRVEASNNDGVWNTSGASLAIRILPPWWAALWFRSLAALTIMALTIYIYRSRVRSLRLAAARLELQVSERTRELEERSRDLQIAKDAAVEANHAKSTFLANMSHELRTPLNAILGFSAMVGADPNLPEQHRKDLDMVKSSGDHLLRLIDDVLDMAKIEAGNVAVEDVAFDLHALVNSTVHMIRERASAKNLQLVQEVSAAAPRFIRSDAVKLRQVLTNLISNAIKYTEKGQVIVRLDARPRDRGPGFTLVFEVEDTGIGIAPEDQKRIFEPFVQAGSAKGAKGTGLGLSISRRFVSLLGGTIHVASAPARGSLFRVEAPAQSAELSEVETGAAGMEPVIALAPGQAAYRILIVEDQRENWLLLRRVLETAGFQVQVAENGSEALETFKAWRPHFIWMDLRLPVINGIEAAMRIREMEGGKAVKIVAVTASAFRSQREEVLAAGMDDFLRKPYRFGEIFDCLARHLGVRYVRGASPETATDDLSTVIYPKDLAILPKEILESLEKAVILLDAARIDLVIRRISQVNPAVGATLARFAVRLEYTPILNLVQSSKSATMRADA